VAPHEGRGVTFVLGLNSTHDAAAALLRDGELVMAVEEERLSRVKHHFGMPRRAIAACAAAAGVSIADVEHAAFYMNPRKWLASNAVHFLRGLPASRRYLARKPALWRSFVGVSGRLRAETGFRGRLHVVDHHTAHIESAFWPSGFEEAAALTIDGAGEAETTVLARVDERDLVRLASARYPVSLGKAWEAVSDWLGWRPTRDEGKVMGLAPYGDDRFAVPMAQVLGPGEGDLFHVDLSYFAWQRGGPRLFSEKFVRVFGPPREPDGAILDHHRALASALQRQTEEIVLALARRLRRETGLARLVMAGGVALNCAANGRLVREGVFDDVFIQPAAGDNGASLGAALHVAHRRLGAPRGDPMRHAFHGPGFDETDVLAAAAARGLEPERPRDVVARTAELLAGGAIVGWMQGRMEYGPRALGGRSILASPCSAEAKDVVNRFVKFREGFRPFAPSVPLESAGEWFEAARPSPYMLLSFAVRPDRRDRIPAVTHVDGSARVQTVAVEENRRFHELLVAFGERTGVPVLLNTSFNVRGEPIVCTPAEGLDALRRTGLTAVVIGDLVFRKTPDADERRS
jgi:carbamoyltransferase